jgi:AcrR family transcriptional regulator
LRTRRSLRDALIALLVARDWDSISVQDICDRADIGRSTFYTHFADKEELLAGGFEDLRQALRLQRTTPAAPADPLRFARGVIDHAHEQRQLFRALVGKRSGHTVYQGFRKLVVDLVKEDLARSDWGTEPVDAIVHYVAGAFLELLTWWVDARSGLQPSELEALFRRMTSPALDAAR